MLQTKSDFWKAVTVIEDGIALPLIRFFPPVSMDIKCFPARERISGILINHLKKLHMEYIGYRPSTYKESFVAFTEESLHGPMFCLWVPFERAGRTHPLNTYDKSRVPCLYADIFRLHAPVSVRGKILWERLIKESDKGHSHSVRKEFRLLRIGVGSQLSIDMMIRNFPHKLQVCKEVEV